RTASAKKGTAMSGARTARCGERVPLQLAERGASGLGEVEQAPQLRAVEGRALRRALDLDEGTGPRHDDVHVRARLDVLLVRQVEDGCPVDDAHAHSGDGIDDRVDGGGDPPAAA